MSRGAPVEAENALRRRDAILAAVSYSASRLLRGADWREEISGILGRLGAATDVSRVYLFENHRDDEGRLLTSQRFEWAGPEVEPQIENPRLQGVPFEGSGMERWEEVLSRGETVHGLVREMPERERRILEPQGILSLVVVPVFVSDVWWGFFGFDDCGQERRWSRTELDAVRAAADTVAAAIQRDRTQRALQERNEQLLQAQKMEAVGRLAGGVAHDFNNQLTAISGYAELLLAQIGDERARQDCEEIIRAAERAASLTRRLLTFSRREKATPRRVRIGEVVEETERMMNRLLGEPVEVTTDLGSDVPEVWVDRGQLEQVLVNLAVNARDAMPRGGELTIVTGSRSVQEGTIGELPAGLYAELVVTDTGEGMGSEVQERIFEPFFTTKESEKGTGLGLSIVYGIVTQSGGWIDVESRPGEGTSFRILLPEADAAERSAEVGGQP
ncbi:MAG: ATP-binding protein [Thermoanaerobaculia bacterium]|nr:ATP-binding protein [Thermoanaerobaculia bacterium]